MSKEKVHQREKVLAKGKIGLYFDYSIRARENKKLLMDFKSLQNQKTKAKETTIKQRKTKP